VKIQSVLTSALILKLDEKYKSQNPNVLCGKFVLVKTPRKEARALNPPKAKWVTC
jgi:hypothetical protein